MRPQAGFTLAELLIALLILGVISTFTIPKILTSQGNAKRAAVFKETIAAFSDTYYAGYIQGEVTEANVATYMRSHINAIKICTNSATEGCWSASHPIIVNSYRNYTGFVLANGATICGMDDAGSVGYDAFIIDWDGPSGKNIEGDDQVILKFILDSSQGKAGTVTSHSGYPTSKTFYESLWQ